MKKLKCLAEVELRRSCCSPKGSPGQCELNEVNWLNWFYFRCSVFVQILMCTQVLTSFSSSVQMMTVSLQVWCTGNVMLRGWSLLLWCGWSSRRAEAGMRSTLTQNLWKDNFNNGTNVAADCINFFFQTKYSSRSQCCGRMEECDEHPGRGRDYWCQQDCSRVCADCLILGEHRGHPAARYKDHKLQLRWVTMQMYWVI